MKVKIPICLAIYPEIDLDEEDLSVFSDEVEDIKEELANVLVKPTDEVLAKVFETEAHKEIITKLVDAVFKIQKAGKCHCEISTFIGKSEFVEVK
jgi:hypothetical protein